MLALRSHCRSLLGRTTRALSPKPATAAIGIILAAAIVAACGGGSATVSPVASPGAASSAQAGSAAPSNGPASTPAQATASPAPSTGSGAIPSDPCSVVTAADVEAAFGGSSSAGKVDENGACVFEVSGTIHAGPNESVPGDVRVSFSDEFTTYERAKVVFGEGVSKVDGLGTEAWYALNAAHARIAGGELVVGATWVGNFNRETLTTDTIALAKTILSRV
jgi:hypothetical protein